MARQNLSTRCTTQPAPAARRMQRRCSAAGPTVPQGSPLPGERMLAAGVSSSAGPWLGEIDRLVAVGGRIAGALGVPAQGRALAARLTGVRPETGDAGLVRAFGLGTTAATLHVGGGASSEQATLDLLRVFHLQLPPPPKAASRAAWEMALVVRLGQLAGAIQTVNGRLVPGPSGLRLVADGSETARDLNGREGLLERRGASWRLNAIRVPGGLGRNSLVLGGGLPGGRGRAARGCRRRLRVDMVGEGDLARRARPRSSRWPEPREVASRAQGTLRTGAGGRRDRQRWEVEFRGLAFRRALELPDTLFAAVAAREFQRSVGALSGSWVGPRGRACARTALSDSLAGAPATKRPQDLLHGRRSSLTGKGKTMSTNRRPASEVRDLVRNLALEPR